MGVAGIDLGVGVDAELALEAALLEGLELEAESVDELVGLEGDAELEPRWVAPIASGVTGQAATDGKAARARPGRADSGGWRWG